MSATLEVSGLVKRFGDVLALSDVTLALSGPKLVCVLGPNGAGKTTLIDLALGLTEPSAGEVRLFGAKVNERDYPRRRVGVVMQREFVLDGMRVVDYADLFAAIYGGEGATERILRRARLEDRGRTFVDKLSGGEAARLFIAAASVHEPEVLFLDEPTGPLDPENKIAVGELLCELSRSSLLMMTTHDLEEAERLADEVVFLEGGRLRAHGSKDALVRGLGADATLRDAYFHFTSRALSSAGEVV